MDISAEPIGDATVITASGELDMAVAAQLRARLDEAIGAGPAHVIVDLTAVTFVDSTILGVLVGARNKLGQDRIRIACGCTAVVKTFRLTGLDQVFTIRPALADLLPPA